VARSVQRKSRRLRMPSAAGLEFPYRSPTTPAGVDPAPSSSGTGVDFDTDWSRRGAARMTRALLLEGLLRPSVALLARPNRRGGDRLADIDGPAIFVANHHSHVDTPLLLTSIPEPWRHRMVVAAAADYFFPTKLKGSAAALALGAIPIERSKVGRRSADLAADLLDDRWSLLIYPEGGRSKDGWGQPFRGGAAYLAIRCGVPVVPIYLSGTGRILRKGRAMPSPSATTVIIGSPVEPQTDETTRHLAERIEAAVGSLSDEAATDWWQARRRAHSGEEPSLTGPEGSSWRRSWALSSKRAARGGRRGSWPRV
jgi:1-acyl-sn-glycerol-3-phosphate acyltransferase